MEARCLCLAWILAGRAEGFDGFRSLRGPAAGNSERFPMQCKSSKSKRIYCYFVLVDGYRRLNAIPGIYSMSRLTIHIDILHAFDPAFYPNAANKLELASSQYYSIH